MAFDKVVDSAELDASFTAIADAIREKKGTTAVFTPAQMADEIRGISGSGIPLIETGATDKISNLILVDVHFPGGMVEDITPPETLAGAKCYYNGVLLPGIPAEILAEYPYIWIRKNNTSGYYDLILSKKICYQNNSGVYGGGNDQWYRTPIENPDSAWVLQIHNYGYWGIDTARTVLWSNHDILNGSATATDIYFEGSEPVPAE